MIDEPMISRTTWVVVGYVVLVAGLIGAVIRLISASDRFRSAKFQLDDTGRQLDDTRRQLEDTRRELAQAASDVTEAKQQLERVRDINSAISTERARLRESLADVTQKNSALQSDLKHVSEERDGFADSVKRLEAQNVQIYDEHREAEKTHVARGIELDYWHHFANLVLHDSRSQLGKVRSFLEIATPSTDTDQFRSAADTVTFVTDLLELGEARDITERVREIRKKMGARAFNGLPRLRRFVEEWAKQIGERFESKLPSKDHSLLFIGSWAHIELILTNV